MARLADHCDKWTSTGQCHRRWTLTVRYLVGLNFDPKHDVHSCAKHVGFFMTDESELATAAEPYGPVQTFHVIPRR